MIKMEKKNYFKNKEEIAKTEETTVAVMHQFVVSTPSKPVIGTFALASCFAVIFEDNYNHHLLAHLSSDYDKTVKEILKYLINDDFIKVKIILGTYTRKEIVEQFIIDLNQNKEYFLYDFLIDIISLPEFLNKEYESIEFAYDTRNEHFINANFNELMEIGKEENYGRN